MPPSQALLKVSPQRQVTLTRAIWEEMGKPSHVLASFVKHDLILKPVFGTDLEEASQRFAKHGLTMEVLKEALLIVDRRKAEADRAAGRGEVGGRE